MGAWLTLIAALIFFVKDLLFEAYGIENIGKKLYNNREYSVIECLREIFIILNCNCKLDTL